MYIYISYIHINSTQYYSRNHGNRDEDKGNSAFMKLPRGGGTHQR